MNRIVSEDIGEICRRAEMRRCFGKAFVVTGASGFMGKYLVRALMSLNDSYPGAEVRVTALCRREESGRRAFTEYLESPYFHLQCGPIEERREVLGPVDYIFHAAGISSSRLFLTKPVEVIGANVMGTRNMLKLAAEKQSRGLLFFSSGAVYGTAPEGETRLVEETTYGSDPLNPANCYAESKRMGENLCASYRLQHGVPARIVRISHTYGPGIDLDDGHVYSDFVRSILNGEPLRILGTGKDKRPFCYISDAAAAYFKILFAGEGVCFNMANNQEIYSVEQLAGILADEFRDEGLRVEKNPAAPDAGEHRSIEVSTQKLEKLGWSAQVGVREGFRRTVESFRERVG